MHTADNPEPKLEVTRASEIPAFAGGTYKQPSDDYEDYKAEADWLRLILTSRWPVTKPIEPGDELPDGNRFPSRQRKLARLVNGLLPVYRLDDLEDANSRVVAAQYWNYLRYREVTYLGAFCWSATCPRCLTDGLRIFTRGPRDFSISLVCGCELETLLLLGAKPGRRSLRSALFTLDQLEEIQPPEPLIEGLLFEDSLAAIYGQPGSYKSFIALDMALSVVTGEKWHGHHVNRGPALYVAAEGVSGMRSRVRAWREDRSLWQLPEDFKILGAPPMLLEAGDLAEMVEIVDEMNPALIVIDTLARTVVGQDENTTETMGRLIEAGAQLQRATGACVLFVHHDTKAGGTLRGSSALDGGLDTEIFVKRNGSFVTLKNRAPEGKQKNAPEHRDITLEAVQVGSSLVLEAPIQELIDPPESKLDLRIAQVREYVATHPWASMNMIETSIKGGSRLTRQAVDTLVDLGELEADPSRRGRYYVLTPAGHSNTSAIGGGLKTTTAEPNRRTATAEQAPRLRRTAEVQ